MKSQKLGRGLGELLGEIDEAYENEVSQKDSIIEIALRDIRPNPFQPRKHFEESSLYELGESIKNDGLIQPIIVTEDVDGYVLIAGERRLRASKLAKLKTIRAIILNSDEQKMRQFALIENIQRDELNSIELAHAYGELIKLHNITQDELSTRIHKSRTHITNTIRLLQLSQKTQRALIEKKISTGHAKVLVGLDEKQQQLIVNSIVGQKLSVREVEATIKSIKNNKPESDNKSVTISYNFKEIKEKLSALGFKSKNSNKSLTIEFDNENQINIFLAYLKK
ncbi:MAG: chromosome partitioning protein ParB [Sulfurimonas sp. RIFCSPHIGHO2_12_FULL_36_9]|jgi:ParB family chromosome partitioning protein|uniref:ParB/RepB/Spo0J family partition protein n=1 Tax=unclassified Sulfurimonas TaxID=2623549 RepID=UPI0008ACC5D1|nr:MULTISPECIES: ParB/RepB/Spo0J family partition protein [unclassified Sulfurimonas]OHD97667.1 MAG: chromosome partitioning protein ParB [Sulfurimonas sp. RIFCSPHIGHO2_12_FULL_36_9]OHD98092.1 MAG: chromosome partitioning protein ParB [Sulfurimonas sp. RIFCSPLOWO2_02_FULL_36_28]OHE01616.1 MAG: chromosome partitioning protein ParB [Sulfurimonas sp. RIFCSPLOWO2_12_36_12]OHE03100.1 MAG: chromosome partitioning protein ParB [Sulfurimonas sp. RIFCSPLOWO2_12_FULL_36_74]